MLSRIKVISVVSILLSSPCYADSPFGPLNFEVGVGKVSFNDDLNAGALTSKGYVINSSSQDSVDDNSFSVSLSMNVTPTVSAEVGLIKLGEIKSSLDVTLPAGTTAEEAAQDIVDTSPQQLGGLSLLLGGLYTHPVTNRVGVNVGAGAVFAKDDHRITINNESFDYDDSSTSPYVKLGVEVSLAPKFAATANAERYFFDNPVDRYSIGLSYIY